MKKVLYPLSLGVILLAGCTSTDVLEHGPDTQTNAIGFENYICKQARALEDGSKEGDLTSTNLDKFYVHAYYTPVNQSASPVQVFDGTEISRNLSDPNPVWGYENKRYWVPNTKYYFYAYSCGDIKLSAKYGIASLDLVNDKDRVLRFTGYICDGYHQHDLIYATNEGIEGKAPGETAANDKVTFKFSHILTKIKAVFISDFDPSYDVYISNVVVSNFRNKGTYNPKANDDYKWGTPERNYDHFPSGHTSEVASVSLSVPKDNVAVKGAKTVTTGTAYVLPYNYSNGDVYLNFTIEVKEKGKDVTLISRHIQGSWSPNWKLGYSYTYNIKVTGTAANLEEIGFGNMNVNGWSGDDNTTTDVDITFSVN